MKRDREILQCIVTSNDGRVWENNLRLNEVHLVKTLARENAKVEVSIITISQERFNSEF